LGKNVVKGSAFVKGTAKGSVSLAVGGSVTIHLERTTAQNLLAALMQALEPPSGVGKGPKPKGPGATAPKGTPKGAPKATVVGAPKGAPKGRPKAPHFK
jgi:hypothetical protein